MNNTPFENMTLLACCLPMLLIIGAFIALIVFLVVKAGKDSWTGEITDKNYNSRRDSETNKM